MALGTKVTMREIRNKAKEFILEEAPKIIPGPQKMDSALDKLAAWLDERATWEWAGPLAPLLEAGDGPLFRKLLGAITEAVYDEMKELGHV